MPPLCGKGVARLAKHTGVETLFHTTGEPGANRGPVALFATDAATFMLDPTLREEVFGAASLLVRCDGMEGTRAVLESLEGQLTITLQMETSDLDAAAALLPALERRAGRILVNGWPTGVEVASQPGA